MRKRAYVAVIAAVGIAWFWQRDPADPTTHAATGSSATTRAGIGELIARLPSPAKLKLRPLYIIEGGLRLEGQTIDEEKRPVGGVVVTLNGARSVVSEADGSFAFDHLAEAEYAVTAEKEFAYAEDTISLRDDSDPMELELKTGVGVKIHVENAHHEPIRDAALEAGRHHEVTDAEGNARVRGLDFGRERLIVSAAGYGPQTVELATGDDPRANLAQNVVLEPGAPFAGMVVDQDGKPAPNASVKIEQAHYSDCIDADDKGHFDILLAPGTVMASAHSDEDLANADEAFRHDGAQRDIVIHVTTGASAIGIVVDPAGTPVVGASVQVGSSFATTDDHGHFKIVGIEPGLVDVTANDQTMASVKIKVEVKRGPPLDLRIAMVTSSIAGIVRDSAGQPVEGANVSADGQHEIGSGYCHTDEHGAFDFGGLPPGDYEITVTRDKDHAGTPKGVVVATGTRNLLLRLPDLGSVAGRVLENGVPVPYFGISISDDPEPTWTSTPDSVRADDGQFVKKDLRPGVYSVAVIGAFERKVIKNVRVSDGGIAQLGDITVAAGRTVHGVVHDEHGVPVAGAVVSVGSRSGSLDNDSLDGKASGTQVTRSDATGAFELVGLEPDTLYVQAIRDHDVAAPREIAADETNVELVIQRAGSLDGTIANQRGRYMSVTVRAVVGSNSSSERTNLVGEFHFERLAAGDYVLDFVSGIATVPQRFHIEAGATTVLAIAFPKDPIAVTIASVGCKRIYLEVHDQYEASEDCNGGIATFADVMPGIYTACAEDVVTCSEITVAASPNRQATRIVYQAPPPEPAPAEDSPDLTPDPTPTSEEPEAPADPEGEPDEPEGIGEG